jgi:hypothetical protein
VLQRVQWTGSAVDWHALSCTAEQQSSGAGCHLSLLCTVNITIRSVSCILQVDATVVAGFMASSTFQRLATSSQAEQRAVLENAFHTIGIDVCNCTLLWQSCPSI